MRALRDLDRILRGDASDPAQPPIAFFPVFLLALGLLAATGATMGLFALTRTDGAEYRQMAASALKLPLLFIITIVVTFPSLYVFNVLFGSKLQIGSLAKSLLVAMAAFTAVLAALAPVVAFFSLTTTNYPFVVLLNVAEFTAAGLLAMNALRKALAQETRITRRGPLPLEPTPPAASDSLPVARRVDTESIDNFVYIWMILFGVVGAQCGWLLRSFIGNPNVPFTWFRIQESSIIDGIFRA
ncbi:MAG: hypothetical protein ACRCZF_16970, partial [Gemmataceae bacterium]